MNNSDDFYSFPRKFVRHEAFPIATDDDDVSTPVSEILTRLIITHKDFLQYAVRGSTIRSDMKAKNAVNLLPKPANVDQSVCSDSRDVNVEHTEVERDREQCTSNPGERYTQ